MNDAPYRPILWWQRATGYQIYPRSFADGNGDGVGDLRGILSKLDYLADLGIGFIWLSPIYASPMVDNGYDISDYRAVAPVFGTLADVDRLIDAAGARDIGIVMDLVVNHTSDRHAWFQAALADRTAPERDWYIFRDPDPDGGPPDDRQSFFGGPAWTLDPATGQYFHHLFAPEQPDLDWRNSALRQEVYAMMLWWRDRGIAGFRMDVIDLIGKDIDAGVVAEGPMLHPWLQEMHREVLAGHDLVTVGESWHASPETAPLYCGRERGELSMIFQFEHIVEGWGRGGKWDPKPRDLVALKRVLNRWQAALARDGWNSLFWSNHDLPRAVSAFGSPDTHPVASAKALATVLHLMRGTPFVYQGEEIGMTNIRVDTIDDVQDVEARTQYAAHVAAGGDPAEFLAGLNANGRDNARTPMQWEAAPHAGFSTGAPWLPVNPNHREINVARQRHDPASVLAHYKALIALRRTHDIVVLGTYTPAAELDPRVFAYHRDLGPERLAVVANLSDERIEFSVPADLAIFGRCLISNASPRDGLTGQITLAPWEAFAILASSTGDTTDSA